MSGQAVQVVADQRHVVVTKSNGSIMYDAATDAAARAIARQLALEAFEGAVRANPSVAYSLTYSPAQGFVLSMAVGDTGRTRQVEHWAVEARARRHV